MSDAAQSSATTGGFDEITRKRIEDAAPLAHPPGRHCARSALRHLERARAIREVDPEFAVLHAITAEEEAATAVFHALKRAKYDGSRGLNGRNHAHKAALLPFLQGVGEFLFGAAKKMRCSVELRYHETDLRAPFAVRLRISASRALLLDRPFDFEAKLEGVPYDFADELEKVVSVANAKSIEDHIRKRANKRNQVLYAAGQGIPHVTVSDRYLPIARDRVLALLLVFLMIDQHKQQPFIVQALAAFRKLLSRFDRRLAEEFQ